MSHIKTRAGVSLHTRLMGFYINRYHLPTAAMRQQPAEEVPCIADHAPTTVGRPSLPQRNRPCWQSALPCRMPRTHHPRLSLRGFLRWTHRTRTYHRCPLERGGHSAPPSEAPRIRASPWAIVVHRNPWRDTRRTLTRVSYAQERTIAPSNEKRNRPFKNRILHVIGFTVHAIRLFPKRRHHFDGLAHVIPNLDLVNMIARFR